MIYVFHFFVVISLYILFGRNKQTEKTFIVTSFVYVLFIFGQRWMTGTDFPGYLRYYLTDFVRYEWGYFGLQQLFSHFNLYFGWLIFVVLLITQFNFFRFFLKFKKHASLLIAIFLISEIFFGQMSQIRQYTAISFFVNSYYHAYKNEYPKSLINLILAYSFHNSALYFLPFLFIKLPVAKNKKWLLAFFIIACFLPLFEIHFLFELPLLDRYSSYIGGQFDVPLSFNHYIKFYTMIAAIIYYIVHLKPLENTRTNRLILNGIMLYILIYGFSFNLAPLYRVATFLQVFEIVFLGYFADKLRNLPEFVSSRIVYLLFLGIFFFSGLVDSYRIAEYEFRPLRIYENRPEEQLFYEINTFYD